MASEPVMCSHHEGRPWPVLLMVRELGIGGCERDLTRTALGLDRSLFVPHVACFHPEGPRGDELRRAGVPILRLPVQAFRSFGALRGALMLRNYLDHHGIKLVQAFDVPLTMFGIPLARLYRAPVIISSQLGSRRLYPSGSGHLLRVSDQLADRIVVNCEALRRHMVVDEKVPPGKLFVCYNGVDTSAFRPSSGEPRPAQLAGASLVVGTVCALRPEKRVDLLVEAFAKVHGRDSGLRLVIVGSGPELGALERQRDSLGLGTRCVLERATDDVVRWMRAIDIFVLSSSTEGFPNAVLEALSSGCCVVASRVGGVPEVIVHEHNGLLFECGSAEDLVRHLTSALADSGLRRRLSAAAVQTARERFSTEIYIDRIQRLYLELLGSTGTV